MPNRILKETICTSENIDQLTAFQETMFYRLMVNCDDFGRMDARPKLLSSKLFPLKDIRANQIEDALRALTSAELVILYTVDGKPFLQMKTWDRHQQIRAKKSKYPAPESGTQADDSTCNQMISDDSKCPRNPIQYESNPNPNTNTNKRFTPPTRDEVAAYIAEKGYNVDPDHWMAHYESNGWKVGSNPMKDWRAAVRTWARNDMNRPRQDQPRKVTAQQYEQRQYTKEEDDAIGLEWMDYVKKEGTA